MTSSLETKQQTRRQTLLLIGAIATGSFIAVAQPASAADDDKMRHDDDDKKRRDDDDKMRHDDDDKKKDHD